MDEHSPLSNMMSNDALFIAQVDSADKALDEVLFGSVFDEDVPAGVAPAIKQPSERFAAAAAGAAAAVKLEMHFAEADDNEVEHLKRETCENLPFGAAHWQHDDAIIQDDPAADQTHAADRKPSPLPPKILASLSSDATIQDYLSRIKRLRRRRKRSQHTSPRTSQRYVPFSFFAFAFSPNIKFPSFTSPSSKLPTKEGFSP